jgi:hypothetical protein
MLPLDVMVFVEMAVVVSLVWYGLTAPLRNCREHALKVSCASCNAEEAGRERRQP